MKRMKKSCLAFMLAVTAMGTFALSGCGDPAQDVAFTAYYGDYFTLPFAGKVVDSYGREVALQGNSFQVWDEKGYTLQGNGERYKMTTKEFRGVVRGDYGRAPVPIDPEFVKRCG